MMKLIFLVLITCRILMCAANTERFRRFIGGRKAEPAQFPYMVSLRDVHNNGHFCGGTIIDKRFILTSAHCLMGKKRKDFFIAAGTNYVDTWSKRYFVKRFATHVHFNTTKHTDDIGLILLKKDIQFSEYIQKIPLEASEPPINVTMTTCGWGCTRNNCGNSPTLQYSKLTSMPLKLCRKQTRRNRGNFRVTKRHICTYNSCCAGICDGDSGGPLVYHGKQVGIVSWSIACGCGFPDVYVKVSSYTNWIKFTKEKLSRL